MRRMTGAGVMIAGVVLLGLLFVIKGEVEERDLALCAAVSAAQGDMAQCPAHDGLLAAYLSLAMGLSVALILGGSVLAWVPVKVDRPRKVPRLEGREREVYVLLGRQGGSMYQGDLLKELGIGKVSLTRLLDKLEQKGVVERRRRGMANLVVRKD